MITLRPLDAADLPLIAGWLGEPHVAAWWTDPVEHELESYRAVLGGDRRKRVLVAERDATPIGWMLEKNGLALVEERAVPCEPEELSALYRIRAVSAPPRSPATPARP